MSNLIKSKKGTFVLPGIVSAIIPGVGQFIKGHIVKGIAFVVAGIAFSIVSWALGWIPLVSTLIWAVGVIAWVINVLDALFSSKDMKKESFGA